MSFINYDNTTEFDNTYNVTFDDPIAPQYEYIINNIDNSVQMTTCSQENVNITEIIKIKKDIINILNNTLNKYHKFIFEENSEKSDNKYENLCNENKKTDNMIGYLMLITYLDKNDIIKERINELLENIMNNILEKESDEIFKLLNCIQNICKISKEYIINYIEIIKQLKDKKYNSKVRCKVMDIEDSL